ncbi:hypothetical protein MMC16_007589 [Acarospora aff. strigata]|nr:hypothetical protein [Acarospora aff. strigata]
MLLALLTIISLLITPLLAIPANTPPGPSSHSSALVPQQRKNYDCFEDDLSDRHEPFHIVSQRDCVAALQQIQGADKTYAPMVFAREPGIGFEVPHSWRSGSCIIYIDIAKRTPGKTVQVSLVEVIKASIFVMGKCCKDTPNGLGKGGRAVLASKSDSGGHLVVAILGRPVVPVNTKPYLPGEGAHVMTWLPPDIL